MKEDSEEMENGCYDAIGPQKTRYGDNGSIMTSDLS